ncbi:MAG: hypothetical protein HYX72_02060 [Acidobacteria bacterium]|nr:hypothetical protein [Acidobacteriota bacterium]
MLRRLGLAIYRAFFWTYERGTWQYDLMVIAILAFIFLTPRAWFHDKPLVSTETNDVVLLQIDHSHKKYQLRAALIDGRIDASLEQGVRRVLRGYTGHPVQITRIQPAMDARGQVISYEVWVRE